MTIYIIFFSSSKRINTYTTQFYVQFISLSICKYLHWYEKEKKTN